MPAAIRFPDLLGWEFAVTERSMSSYQLLGVHETGASLVLVGFDYDALLEEARAEAALMDSRRVGGVGD